eukprot:41844-Chlamydomonas_euryale.AAC.3
MDSKRLVRHWRACHYGHIHALRCVSHTPRPEPQGLWITFHIQSLTHCESYSTSRASRPRRSQADMASPSTPAPPLPHFGYPWVVGGCVCTPMPSLPHPPGAAVVHSPTRL